MQEDSKRNMAEEDENEEWTFYPFIWTQQCDFRINWSRRETKTSLSPMSLSRSSWGFQGVNRPDEICTASIRLRLFPGVGQMQLCSKLPLDDRAPHLISQAYPLHRKSLFQKSKSHICQAILRQFYHKRNKKIQIIEVPWLQGNEHPWESMNKRPFVISNLKFFLS